MHKYALIFLLLIAVCSCDQTTNIIEKSVNAKILPVPKKVENSSGMLCLSNSSKLYTSNPELNTLLDLYISETKTLFDVHLEKASKKTKEADILFEVDSSLAADEYKISVRDEVHISGGSYQALCMAKSSLLQVMDTLSGKLAFPVMEITDRPDAKYRGLLVDLARQWHSMETIKKLVDLTAFYKMNYLQLHFSDYQSYTLPSKVLPKLSTPDRHYSFEELEELENYSRERGVFIVPEIDIPGHSSPFVNQYPEIFAIKDKKDNPWIINMGKEEVYQSLEELIAEICDIFKSTPYYHIGGDEAIFYAVEKDPDVQAYSKKHHIGEDVHELYRHFLVRLNEIVKKQGKTMCVWEGFRKEGTIEIPKDIIVFEFETNRYLPDQLIEDGYTVVNTSWKPTYVVNRKKWEPKTIYAWNMWRWENWFDKAPSFHPIQVEKSPLVIGAQMCAWEQADKSEVPSLRKRLPALSERIWNTEEVISYDEFYKILETTDSRLSILINDHRQDSLLLDYNFAKEE